MKNNNFKIGDLVKISVPTSDHNGSLGILIRIVAWVKPESFMYIVFSCGRIIFYQKHHLDKINV